VIVYLLLGGVLGSVLALGVVLAAAAAIATALEWRAQRFAERELLRTFGVEPARRRIVMRRDR